MFYDNDPETDEIDEVIEQVLSNLGKDMFIAEPADIVDYLLDNYPDLTEEDVEDVLTTIDQLRDSEEFRDSERADIEALTAEARSDAADQLAKDMAEDDNVAVSVTEKDIDGDGDSDKITIKQQEVGTDKEDADSIDDKGNSDESDDKPNDSTKNIISAISSYKY